MKSLFLCVSFFTCNLICYSSVSSTTHKRYQVVDDKNDLKILTSSLAKRQIAKIRLDNQLEVYLVSDPQADESATALAVNTGSWSDPKEYPGMAHFLEHMLFMGTKAYPDEKAFSQYISDHGGVSNAYTSLDRTVYMFSINNDSFEHGLDLFSHFFIDPLFKASEVGRELHAVDQEHAKNIQSDGRRQWMIFKETGNPHHPNKAFATGNASTLGHIPREALVHWYQEHYSANLMHLVLYSPLPIETLKDLVIRYFSDVPNFSYPSTIPYDTLCSEKQKGHMTYIKPVKDLKNLSMDWEMPKHLSEDKLTHSAELIAYTLQSGGKNSLNEQLKREGLIESLSANISFFSKQHRFFSLNLVLTKQGIIQMDTVIERCFQAIALMQKNQIPSYLFNEMQTMSKIQYEYQSRDKAFDFVMTTADHLIDEPLQTYPKTTLLASYYDGKTVQTILNLLTPKECLFSVLASPELTGIQPDKKEKWNGGEYAVVPIKENAMKRWSSVSYHPNIQLPEPNPYIPKHLTILNQDIVKQDATTIPTLLVSDDHGKHYFWQDNRYQTPEALYVLGIKTPLLDGQTKSSVATDMLIKTFYQKSAPLLSLASAAGLSANIEQKNVKLFVTINGYSEKAPEFLKHILLSLKTLSCSKEEFEVYKDSLLSFYSNQTKAQPYMQAGEFISNILYSDAPLSSQKSAALKQLSYEDFSLFLQKSLSQCYIEGLYTGNIDKQEISKICESTLCCLSSQNYPPANHIVKEILILPKHLGPYMISEKIQTLGNATLLAVQQGGFSFEKKASQMILSTVLSESFFNTLRSQQQTGYITASWPREVQQELMQFFLVQSSTHQPEDLLARFELFLEGYVKDFSEKLPIERFEEIKKNSIETLQQTPPNLEEMSAQLYDLAFERKGNFSFYQELIGALHKLSYEELKKESLTFLSRKNSQRLAMLVEGEIPENQFLYRPVTADLLKQKGNYVSYK